MHACLCPAKTLSRGPERDDLRAARPCRRRPTLPVARAIGPGLVPSSHRNGVRRAACHVPDRAPFPRVHRGGSWVAWSA